jgi:16S rRNA (cytosine967-C5)-methyltransferase
VANEISFERMKLVQQVVRNGKVTNFDGRQMPAEVGRFDRILIDAPCTGLGALRRRPEIKWRRQPDDLPGLIALQQDLLSSAAKLLKPGGIIGYATCSPHLAETKWQVRSFLKSHPQFNRLPVTKDQDLDGDMQLWTFRDDTDSMFLSLLQNAP